MRLCFSYLQTNKIPRSRLLQGMDLEVPPRFGLGVKELQSSALPLGYGTEKMERITRLELATSTMARWRSTR